MKIIIISLILLFNSTIQAEGIKTSVYYINTVCVAGCNSQPRDFNIGVTIGAETPFFGAELIIANNDIGGSLFVPMNLTANIRLLAGISSLPDTATIYVGSLTAKPDYGVLQDSSNISAPFIGIEYKMFSVRYYEYSPVHSASFKKYDATTKTFIEQQYGVVRTNKKSIWMGLSFAF